MALWKDWFGGGRSGKEVPAQLHDAMMAQALDPQFYGRGLFEDTFPGRFENATIHAMLVFRRLRNAGENGQALAQDLFDELFSNFDDALREVGTGDLKVGKKIKDLAKAFYGRAEVYDSALDDEADEEGALLVDALVRNVKLTTDTAARMARYIKASDSFLAEQSDDALLQGRLNWPRNF